MAIARLDIPAVMLYGGSIYPGHYKGQRITIQEVFEAVGAHAAGRITDDELTALDKWVRNHTTNRFGPVREVEPGLVFEVAFDSVQRSKRHRSGLAMRFPRINRIRWDKPVDEADRLDTLERLLV